MKKQGSAAARKKSEKKKNHQSDSINVQIEKHLLQAEKEHKILWRTTQKSLDEISKILELVRDAIPLSGFNSRLESTPDMESDKKTEQETKRILKKENLKHLEAYLVQRFNSLKMIQGFLNSPSFISEESLGLQENSEDESSKKILVVDDDHISIKLTSHFLQKADYDVTCAMDGKEGLQKALEISPDIILIDLMMPGMDGFQLLAQLKKESQTSGIPVLILSSLCNEKEIIRGLKEGAMDFITKPFSPQVLLAKLEKIVESQK